MLLKILKKDFLAYWIFFLVGFAAQLMLSSVMIIYGRDDSWRPFIFIGCVQVSTVILFFLLYEKLRKYDKILLSLPVTKNHYLLSKYAGSLILAVFGSVLWYLAASYIYSTFDSVPADFYKYNNLKTISVMAVFFSLFISLFVPLTIKIKQVFILIIPLILIAYIYVKGAENLKFGSHNDIEIIAVLFSIIIISVPLVISYFTSIRILKNMDLV